MTEKEKRSREHLDEAGMEDVWIIGGGRFGRMAYDRLRGRRNFRFTIVDRTIGSLWDDCSAGASLTSSSAANCLFDTDSG